MSDEFGSSGKSPGCASPGTLGVRWIDELYLNLEVLEQYCQTGCLLFSVHIIVSYCIPGDAHPLVGTCPGMSLCVIVH